jgi:hypothetical protein
MSMGWKDTQNFHFGRPRKPPPPPTPPPLYQLCVEKVQNAYPRLALLGKPPFPIETVNWEQGGDDNKGADPQAGGLDGFRLINKRHQVENVLSTLTYLLSRFPITNPHLVEFCASSGYCALPFSRLYPASTVTILDAKVSSVEIAWRRMKSISSRNVQAMVCRTEDYHDNFDIGVALHACGEATDAVMDKCIANRAAFLVVPCCVGRIGRFALGYADKELALPPVCGNCVVWDESVDMPQARTVETTWKADVTKTRLSKYDGRPRPRSRIVQDALGGEATASKSFAALAKAADASQWSHEELEEHPQSLSENQGESMCRKTAKRIVDFDRLEFAKEQGYVTLSFTMVPSCCTPKNEVLFGYPKEWDE